MFNRNFPTLENIEKKLAEQKEMEERGERVEPNIKPFKRNQSINRSEKGIIFLSLQINNYYCISGRYTSL